MVNVKLVGDRVLLQKTEEDEKIGAIFAPSSASDCRRCKVISVGPGYLSEAGKWSGLAVKSGDIVIIPEDIGWEVMIAGETYIVVSEEHILVIFQD